MVAVGVGLSAVAVEGADEGAGSAGDGAGEVAGDSSVDGAEDSSGDGAGGGGVVLPAVGEGGGGVVVVVGDGGTLAPSVGADEVVVVVDVLWSDSAVDSSPRIATISALKVSRRAATSASGYEVIERANSVSRPQTSLSACSSSSPGSPSTESTSWLAMAAVMQR